MKQLIALTTFLKSLKLVPPEQLISWAEDVQAPLFFDTNNNGLECSDVRYVGHFYIERFTGDASLLIAHLTTWLMQLDELTNHDRTNNDLAAPNLTITPTDDNLAVFDIDIEIEFIEHIYLIEDDNGPINYQGKKWRIGEFDLWQAEDVTVSSGSNEIDPEARP